MEQIDVVVIGAGVVGLAIASEVAKDGREVFVFEKNDAFGMETSSRNSEVIHAGLYYEKGSLKARLCAEGRELIYQISTDLVFHRRLGKLIIAVDDSEILALEKIMKTAAENGVADLRMLDEKEIHELEPNVRAVAAIHSPSTGIVDTHQLMKYFASRLKDASGGVEPIVYDSEVVQIEKLADGFRITVRNSSGAQGSVETKVLINFAGLNSDGVAEMAGIDVDSAGYRLHFCKGEYFRVSSRHKGKIKHLVYPVPEEAGLGIHATLDLAGEMKLGPNSIYMYENVVDYGVDESHKQQLCDSAKRFLPFLEPDDLYSDQAGIRPRLFGPGESERDFVIQEESARGLSGFINLIGIESPGLTASPAIGKYVSSIVEDLLR